MSIAVARRNILRGAVATGMMATIPSMLVAASQTPATPPPPISHVEREDRLRRLQAELRRRNLAALLVEAGSSLVYFTGIDWWRSERTTAALIPADGPVLIVTPFFEEPSIREMLDAPGEIRVWQEDENPFRLVADWLKARKLDGGTLAVEDTTRFFIADGVRRLLPSLVTVSGAAPVNALRMIKSPSEIALMQRANDIMIAAYRATHAQVRAGMTGDDINAIMLREIAANGGQRGSSSAQVGPGSALPHGSKERQRLTEGSLVLMDCVCTVHGYHADISRTFVFGEASAEQQRIFRQMRQGMDVAMNAAKVGAPAGSVDDAVRAYYEKLGYGPRYALPGLSHRTGHGIGLDVHEPVNLVHGETTALAPGMCFSNEPGLYLPGRFGVRIEDCFYMTDDGPHFFTQPPSSLDQPFG